jgi:hypothetical protein
VDTESSGVRLALLASPLLGPSVWVRVGALLRGRGWDVVLHRPYPPVTTPADVVGHLVGELSGDLPLVLVPHSNAGLYVGALAASLPVASVVFVDAGVPAGPPATAVAPPELRDLLATLADDQQRLPPWTAWWSPEETDALFPDDAARAAVEREQQRLPLSYFDAAVPSPAGWEVLPAAYLAFGDTYAGERAEAASRGWPVRTLPGGHLLPLTGPSVVAEAIEGLLGLVGLQGPVPPA